MHANFQESSQKRRNYLASLYDYLQSCSKELVFLSDQQEKILQRDWSDRMVDPPGVRMAYEVGQEVDMYLQQIVLSSQELISFHCLLYCQRKVLGEDSFDEEY